MFHILNAALSIIGAATLIYVVHGVWVDVRSFDQTRGGYEAPFTGWTGEPVNWDALDRTADGVVKRGRVIDVFVNMTTGLVSFEVAGIRYDWRTFSDRALIVHRPREAAVRLGFTPEF